MNPSVSSSSVMTSRRMVVLPDPLGPMRVTRSPLATSKSRWSNTVLSPNFLTTFSNRMAGVVSVAGKAVLQSAHEEGGGVAGREEDQPGEGEGLGVGEGAGAVVLRRPDHLRDGDDKEERGVLEHRDHPGPQGGHGGAQR